MVSNFPGSQSPLLRRANSKQVARSVSWRSTLACLIFALGIHPFRAQSATPRDAVPANEPATKAIPSNKTCFRGAEGDEVPQPHDLRSQDGVLKVDLAFRSYPDAKGKTRYCYVTPEGEISPTLRVKPGDTVILILKNEVVATTGAIATAMSIAAQKLDVSLSVSALQPISTSTV